MRGSWILLGAILLAACDRPGATPDSAARADAEAGLRAANLDYDEALVAGDAARLQQAYADDYQVIDDDAGVHGKVDQIRFMTTELDLLDAKSDDVRVTMLGPDAALVTGRFVGRYRLAGKESSFTERYTSIWVRDGGRWRLRHEHSSNLPKEETASTAP